MQIVKVSQPSHWENKINLSTPGETGVWKDYKFVVTSENIKCDYWIVLGDVQNLEKASCDPNKIIYFTDEVYPEKQYASSFLNQFPAVVTARSDVSHLNVIKLPYICHWFLKKNFDFLFNLKPHELIKYKVLSTVSSSLTRLPGHKERFAFINKMIGHFKERLDIYGNGINPVHDKFDALSDYQYSIAIENFRSELYFTEKITDCFLTYTMPIYYGCPNILDYFPEEAMLLIDINDYIKSIEIIEDAIANERFKKNFDYIIDARNAYFEKYNVLEVISNILDLHLQSSSQKRELTIKSSNYSLSKRTLSSAWDRISAYLH